MTEQEKWHLISQVDATMALEGMPLTEEDKQGIKDVLDGKLTYEEAIENVINKYKQP